MTKNIKPVSGQFRCSEFISFYEKLPRPAHGPYLRPVGKKETEPKRLFAIACRDAGT